MVQLNVFNWIVSSAFNPTPLNQRGAGSCLKSASTSSSPMEQWVNCLAQGQNDRFLSCQLGDLIQQLFGYWPNALTTRLPGQAAYVLYKLCCIMSLKYMLWFYCWRCYCWGWRSQPIGGTQSESSRKTLYYTIIGFDTLIGYRRSNHWPLCFHHKPRHPNNFKCVIFRLKSVANHRTEDEWGVEARVGYHWLSYIVA